MFDVCNNTPPVQPIIIGITRYYDLYDITLRSLLAIRTITLLITNFLCHQPLRLFYTTRDVLLHGSYPSRDYMTLFLFLYGFCSRCYQANKKNGWRYGKIGRIALSSFCRITYWLSSHASTFPCFLSLLRFTVLV